MMEMPCVCWRPGERRAVAAVSSAIEGAIVSKVVASAVQQRGRRSGVVVDNHVTVTDSRHPALRMAPAPSSRRQCPRESCTCCSSQSLWLPRVPGLVFSASHHDIVHPLLSCPPAK
jgi:hypothetical protein